MKKAVLHTTTLIHIKASRQALRDVFSTKQGNGSKTAFTATKINFKKLDELMQASN